MEEEQTELEHQSNNIPVQHSIDSSYELRLVVM